MLRACKNTQKPGLHPKYAVFKSGDTADFYVEVVFQWEQDDKEMAVMTDLCPKEYKDRAHKVQPPSI